jgi:hypothetical protein
MKSEFLGLFFSLIIACVSIILLIFPLSIIVKLWALGGLPGASITLAIIFICLNSFVKAYLIKKTETKRGINWGYFLLIPLILFFSLPQDYNTVNTLFVNFSSYRASSSGNIDGCMKIPDLNGSDFTRNNCLYNTITFNTSSVDTIIVCEKMTSKTTQAAALRADCYNHFYRKKAIELKDPFLCERIVGQSAKDLCYYQVKNK